MSNMAHECFCGGQFGTLQSLRNHIESKGHRLRCCCNRIFRHLAHLHQHQRDLHHSRPMPYQQHPAFDEQTPASTCDERQRQKRCPVCSKVCANHAGVRAHREAKHPSCPTCHQHFSSAQQRNGHQRVTGHCYCDEHDERFDCPARCDAHKKAVDHVSSYQCLDCDQSFGTHRALDHHLESAGHAAVALIAHERITASQSGAAAEARARAQEEASLRCEECNRDFATITGFKQHKSSLKHKPLSDLKCPCSSKCKNTFVSPACLLLHLESGSCKSGMDRQKLNALIHTHDTGRHITTLHHAASVAPTTAAGSLQPPFDLAQWVSDLPASLSAMSISGSSSTNQTPTMKGIDDMDNDIGKPSGVRVSTHSITASSNWSSSSMDGVILTPTASQSEWSDLGGVICTPAPTSADGSSASVLQNNSGRKGWACTICGCTRRFKKHKALLDHLKSPFHTPKLFRCPTELLPGGGEHQILFKTLSGLAQHIESGACAGGEGTMSFIARLFEAKIEELCGQQIKLLKAAT